MNTSHKTSRGKKLRLLGFIATAYAHISVDLDVKYESVHQIMNNVKTIPYTYYAHTSWSSHKKYPTAFILDNLFVN